MTSDELTVSDLLLLMWERKGTVLVVAVLGALLGFGVTTYLPARWESRASLLLPLPDTGGSAGGNPLTALIGGGSASPLDILEGVLTSRKAIERIASKSGYDPEKLEDALKVRADSPKNQLNIVIEDEKPDRGRKVLAEAISALDLMTKDLGLSVASRTKKELEIALVGKQTELKAAVGRLTAFQRVAKTVPDPTTPYSAAGYLKAYSDAKIDLGKVEKSLAVARTQAGIAGSAPVELPTGSPEKDVWHDKLVEKETELQLARVHFGEKAPEVVTLREQVEVLRGRIRTEMARKLQAVNSQVDERIASLEANRQLLVWQVDVLKSLADKAPGEAAELMKLQGEVTTLTTVLGELRAQYEKVKIDADVDKVRWSILEDPYTVKPAVNKRFIRSTAIGGALGLALGAFIVFWGYSMNKRKVTQG